MNLKSVGADPEAGQVRCDEGAALLNRPEGDEHADPPIRRLLRSGRRKKGAKSQGAGDSTRRARPLGGAKGERSRGLWTDTKPPPACKRGRRCDRPTPRSRRPREDSPSHSHFATRYGRRCGEDCARAGRGGIFDPTQARREPGSFTDAARKPQGTQGVTTQTTRDCRARRGPARALDAGGGFLAWGSSRDRDNVPARPTGFEEVIRPCQTSSTSC